jgi:hypothetical protein
MRPLSRGWRTGCVGTEGWSGWRRGGRWGGGRWGGERWEGGRWSKKQQPSPLPSPASGVGQPILWVRAAGGRRGGQSVPLVQATDGAAGLRCKRQVVGRPSIEAGPSRPPYVFQSFIDRSPAVLVSQVFPLYRDRLPSPACAGGQGRGLSPERTGHRVQVSPTMSPERTGHRYRCRRPCRRRGQGIGYRCRRPSCWRGQESVTGVADYGAGGDKTSVTGVADGDSRSTRTPSRRLTSIDCPPPLAGEGKGEGCRWRGQEIGYRCRRP